jgi:hypothetical protein
MNDRSNRNAKLETARKKEAELTQRAVAAADANNGQPSGVNSGYKDYLQAPRDDE